VKFICGACKNRNHNSHDTLKREVEGQLQALARTIIDIVEQVPEHLPLQIILTSDHGRLFALSERTIPAPAGMSGHWRAAWGKTDIQYPAQGYIVHDEVVFCHAERFGMTEDFVMPLTEKAFLTSDDRTGKERFAHGGIYPEEVIVPWVVMVRDHIPPKVTITITGRANAGHRGKLILEIDNQLSDINLTLLEVIFTIEQRASQLTLNGIVGAHSSQKFEIEILHWPSVKQAQNAMGQCHLKQPNGLIFEVTAQVNIQSDEMYQSDNILEDLV
jgi:hypothetical protein